MAYDIDWEEFITKRNATPSYVIPDMIRDLYTRVVKLEEKHAPQELGDSSDFDAVRPEDAMSRNIFGVSSGYSLGPFPEKYAYLGVNDASLFALAKVLVIEKAIEGEEGPFFREQDLEWLKTTLDEVYALMSRYVSLTKEGK